MSRKLPSTAFKPGQSGNPSGRPKVVGDIRDMARAKGKEAFEKIVSLLKSKDDRVAFAAASAILDRAYGKPTQYHDVTKRVDVFDISDAELAAIAAGRSVRTIEAQACEIESDPVH